MNAHPLFAKLPEIQVWIDRLLKEHAARGRSTASFGFPRLGGFYSAELLASSCVIEVPRIPVPPLSAMGLPELASFEQGNYGGITYLDTYFVQSTQLHSESLHFHELVHIVQWQHLGAEQFLMAYALGHLLSGGYETNPLEIMAYELQARFDRGSAPFLVERLVRQQLDALVPSLLARLQAG